MVVLLSDMPRASNLTKPRAALKEPGQASSPLEKFMPFGPLGAATPYGGGGFHTLLAGGRRREHFSGARREAAAGAAGAVSSSSSGGELPSLADRVRLLEYENARLRSTVHRLRRSAYGGIVPADALDVALLVSVAVLVVFVGKVAFRV